MTNGYGVTADICPHIMEGKCPFIDYEDVDQVPTVGPNGIGVDPEDEVNVSDHIGFDNGRSTVAVKYYIATGEPVTPEDQTPAAPPADTGSGTGKTK